MRSVRAARSWADRRALAWVAWLLLAGAALLPLRRYKVDNSIEAWLPELQSTGPFPTYVVVGWERGALGNERTFADALRRAPGVAYVLDRQSTVPLIVAMGTSPQDFVVSRDGSYAGAFCFGEVGATDDALARGVRDAVEQHVRSVPAQVAIGGPAVFKASLDEYSQRGMPLILGTMLVAGACVLRWVTGSWSASLPAVAAVVLSQIVLLGLITWRGHAVDMSLSMVPPLMMSLGFSYAAHRALRRDVTPVLVVCGLTAAAGVASAALAPLEPVRLFGFYGTVGLGLVWLATFSLVPPSRRQRRPRTGWLRGCLRKLVWSIAHPRPTLAAIVSISAVVMAGVTLPRLTFESDPLTYFPREARVRRDFETLDRRLTGMLPFQVCVGGDADPRPLIAASDGVRKVLDLTPLIGEGRSRTLWCLASNDALPSLVKQAGAWRTWAARAHVVLEWRGVAAQLAGAERIVRRNAATSIPAMCLIAGAGMLLVRRQRSSLVLGGVAAVLPVAVLVLVLALVRVPLGLPSLLIGAICIGLSVDDTLHLAATAARHGSVRRAMIACFRPCVGSSLANALCAMTFLISPLGPVRQFGLLMAGAVLSGALVNQIVIPHLVSVQRVGRGVFPVPADLILPRPGDHA